MKNKNAKNFRLIGIVLAVMIFTSQAAFATEVSFGTALGLRTYQNDGFGFGGGTSFRPYFTPKFGIMFKL